MSGIRHPAGELGAGVGDGGTQRIFARLGRSLAAIAVAAENHADFHSDALALKGGGDKSEQKDGDESDCDPDGLLHAKKFPMRRNLE